MFELTSFPNIFFLLFLFAVDWDFRNRLHSPFCGGILVLLFFQYSTSTKSMSFYRVTATRSRGNIVLHHIRVVVRCIRADSGFRYNGFAIPYNKPNVCWCAISQGPNFRLKTSFDMLKLF